MKIIFTGGGTGGHFYPVISVVEEMRDIIRREKLIQPTLYFLAPSPYNKGLLFDNDIIYKKVWAGKVRRYKSIMNFFDMFKTFFGILRALWTVFWIFPDVIFSKGGFGSFPVVVAGKILSIPVIVHESDSKPGKANTWAGKFAEKIAVSYPDAVKHFPKAEKEGRVAWTGNPVRKEVRIPAPQGGHEYLELEEEIPTIFIIGGSQGAKAINDAILDILPRLVKKYQIVHQTGKKNFKEVTSTADLVIENFQFKKRYKPYEYMNNLAIRMTAGACDMVITRAGSTLFEIAMWEKPAIVIPIPEEVSHDQRNNAFNYARSGGATVIEENNLTPNILLAEIDRIISNPDIQERMKKGAKSFAKPDAAKTIANEILETVVSHEK